MDAKPQRPVRALRIHDENAPLTGHMPAKTVHQRNKSTSALSTLMQAGATRGGVKRSAFADVSNTTRAQPAKDDSAINTKAYEKVTQEFVHKPVALSKPAQRPLAAKPSSQQLNASITTTITVPAKAPATTSIPVVPTVPAATRVVISRRSTSILRDISQSGQTGAPTQPSSVATTDDIPTKPLSAVTLSATLPELGTVTEEAVAAAGPVQAIETTSGAAVDTTADKQYLLALEQQAHKLESERNTILSSRPALGDADYDDEEEEDEFYYDEAYTGGKSKTDNTTGAATMVLCPRYTNKVMNEIMEAKIIVEASRTTEEIEDEQWDTSMVAEYGEEIFEYMRTLEDRMRPNPHYMDFQSECQWSMRAVLMDWLVQVHHRFTLLPETLFLAVNYIDRFLSCKIVSLGKLQLVGATAIFLAAKYEEVNCPSIQEIVYMVDNGYTQDEILKAERFMLSMLQFELGWPGPMSFLRRISKADDYDLETRTLAKYFLEITVMDERFVGCAPSFAAAGAHCLARLMLRKGEWTQGHVYYSNYTYSQLRQLLAIMVECCEDPQKHHAAVYEKYTDRRFKRASLFVQTEIKKGFRLPVFRRVSAGYRDETQAWSGA